jgi:alpha-L-arabinofuranosidase
MLGCEKNSERMWWTGYGNYAGLLDHGNFGPCIVWNDAVTCFATPSYYMQKMLFTDNAGTSILPFTHNTSDCYWSVSADRQSGKNDILIKVVNKKDKPEKIKFKLTGASGIDPAGVSTTLTGPRDAENSISDPEKVIPVSGTFEAGKRFDYTLPAVSITVLRIKTSL